MIFQCTDCGYTEAIENPLKVCKICEKCGGTMRMSTIAPTESKKPKYAGNIADLPETSLMGELVRGEIYNLKPLKTLKRFKVVQCRFCGCIQVTEGLQNFRCRNCDKQFPFRKKGEWFTKLKDFDNAALANIECRAWKAEVEQKKIYR